MQKDYPDESIIAPLIARCNNLFGASVLANRQCSTTLLNCALWLGRGAFLAKDGYVKNKQWFAWLGSVSIGAILGSTLVSCGSGAVSSGPSTGGSTLSVFPVTADVFPDTPTTFTVSGGTPAYSLFSSNSAALPLSGTFSGNTFTVVGSPVSANTAVDITVKDAANNSVVAKANLHPATLNNQITFTPLAPTGTGCGSGSSAALCGGGDAQVVVKAVMNGVILRARPIRFDVYQGSFQLVTPGTGILVNTLTVNTDEQGEAVVRLTAATGASTQVATLQSTDVTTGLVRRYNFNIIQQTSGSGILSTLPSGAITIKGAKGAIGQEGSCPGGASARVDFYVFGGTPPYRIASPLPGIVSVSPETVVSSGGSFTAQLMGCGKTSLIVTDSKGLSIETASIEAQQGDKGDTAPTTTLTVAPTAVTVGCGQTASVTVAGSGNFSTTVTTAGVNPLHFSVSPTAGPIPSTISFMRANTGTGVPTAIRVNVIAGSTVTGVDVTTTAACP